ncbi:MAG: DapH/DapD/GlmU-related protein [Gammaproteobacteria bacterium]|nr:MAG: 2,3,4,5-tetrahydropyridine-2,6-dicarboxylate N-succinyltransferase [Gammaproteobacteria bacterium]
MSNWLAIGMGSKNSKGKWMEVYFPKALINPPKQITKQIKDLAEYKEGNLSSPIPEEVLPELQKMYKGFHDLDRNLGVIAIIDSKDPPHDVPSSYLRLHLLSHRLVKPNQINLDGIFSILPTVAWTSAGPIDPADLENTFIEKRLNNQPLHVHSLDKFPCMTDYVIPEGVRIANSHRVRLGAYLGEGTTVMHEGFVNFNSGTLGKSMVEGRISQGVVVEEGSDLGGGSSTMGTLSGGNETLISLGKDCLLGANSGLGIPLGDRCIIEAGLYITAGTKIELIQSKNEVKEVKASELAFKDDLLFIRNSLTGKVQCKTNPKKVSLNDDLHSNN